MKLKDWIDLQGGSSALARDLGLKHRATVSAWYTGLCIPSPAMVKRLLSLSAGELSEEDIFSARKKKRTSKSYNRKFKYIKLI
jgi:hypothetical protein